MQEIKRLNKVAVADYKHGSIELEINFIDGNNLKNKHRNGYYLYKLLWCVF
jgi:hypothetical protein